MTSTYDLWYAMAPGHLVVSEIRIERFWMPLWDPILVGILQIPAWLLAGVPGGVLTWYCRPNRIMSPEVREEYERQRESLFVIDELSDQAMLDENYDPHEDDRAPSHLMFHLDQDDDEEMRDSVFVSDVPAGYPGLNYDEEFMSDIVRDRATLDEMNESTIVPLDDDQVRIVDGLAFTGKKSTHARDADNDD
mgnify:CR=1 FL=1